jgi:hypothetical protein
MRKFQRTSTIKHLEDINIHFQLRQSHCKP